MRAAASGRLPAIQLEISQLVHPERLLSQGDLNRSMQHLNSKYREEDVADEVQIEDLLQRRAEKLDVGSLAGGRFSA